MCKTTEEIIAGSAGRIFLRSWLAHERPKAIVLLCHGFNSHSGMYPWAGQQLSHRGMHTYALDLRGRGKSEGTCFYVSSFDDYADDIKAAVNVIKSRHSGMPLYLLGHSAGGVASCIFTLEHQQDLAGLICESFAFKLPAPAFALTVIKFLSRFVPHMKAVTLKNADVSRDARIVSAMDADPLIAGERQPAATVAALVRAGARLNHAFPAITLPLFIMHGSADRATMPQGSEQFFAEAGSKDKLLKIYKDRFHDLLNDVGREEVINDIATWIEERSSYHRELDGRSVAEFNHVGA